jgi:glutathione peroxidase
MKAYRIYFSFALLFLLCYNIAVYSQQEKSIDMANNIFNFSVKDINGSDIKLSDYKGKVLLIVNVASRCGNTPQYKGLQFIYDKYKARGFEILAFPCNDFGSQEPGTNEEIKNFCSSKYNVTFKLFDKVKILGKERLPLYTTLLNGTEDKSNVRWNFEKFLVDKEGNIFMRFKDKVQPQSNEIVEGIEHLLKK